MSRKLRHIREGGAPVEVTCRTINSLFLLRPCGLLNAIIVGALARAKALHPVELSAFAFASNHFHLICWVETVRDLARFMNHFNSKLAREIARLRGWHDKIWSRRYQAIEISDEPRAQEERLRYVLSHGVKEFLVETPEQWPGVHASAPLVSGEPLEGWWFDRTKEHAARRRGKEPDLFEFATREVLELDPLPCWRGLSAEERREHAASMIDAIVAEAAADRHARGIEVLGASGVLEQDPFGRPEKSKKSPAPHFHAASKKAFMDLKAAYSEFYAEYRKAAEKLKAGERLVEFPEGCFPPGLPFVEPEPASSVTEKLLSAVLAAPTELSASATLVTQDVQLPGRSTPPPSSPLTPSTDPDPLVVSAPPPSSTEARAEPVATEDTGTMCTAAASDRRPRPP